MINEKEKTLDESRSIIISIPSSAVASTVSSDQARLRHVMPRVALSDKLGQM